MGAEPEKAKELQAAWDKWNEDNIAPRWGQGKKAGKKAGNRARRRAGQEAS
jgi:hypothetical protein